VNNVGGVVSFTITQQAASVDSALVGAGVTFTTAASNFIIDVTGVAATAMHWTGYVEFVSQSFALRAQKPVADRPKEILSEKRGGTRGVRQSLTPPEKKTSLEVARICELNTIWPLSQTIREVSAVRITRPARATRHKPIPVTILAPPRAECLAGQIPRAYPTAIAVRQPPPFRISVRSYT
jgi:hypothetical protein